MAPVMVTVDAAPVGDPLPTCQLSLSDIPEAAAGAGREAGITLREELSSGCKLTTVLDAAIALTLTSLWLVALPTYFRSTPGAWDALLGFFGAHMGEHESFKWATFWMTHTFHLVCFVSLNALVGLCYYINSPKIERFKTEPEAWPWNSPDPKQWESFYGLLKSTLFIVTINNLLVSVPISWLSYDTARLKGLMDPSMASFPSTSTIVWQIAACLLVEDFMFYWSHRLLHMPFLFKHIHKVHHRYHATIGLASEYAHPLEFYFGNLLPTTMGPALVKAHLVTYFIWIGIRLAKTCEAHCGYRFPFSPFQFLPFANPAPAHEYHHSRGINSCYGSFLCFWDTLCGTNKEFSEESKLPRQKLSHKETLYLVPQTNIMGSAANDGSSHLDREFMSRQVFSARPVITTQDETAYAGMLLAPPVFTAENMSILTSAASGGPNRRRRSNV
jgi:sterol desaturase/sphingolipid hydroxylase (fatty acid hydroxylase superfamily)